MYRLSFILLMFLVASVAGVRMLPPHLIAAETDARNSDARNDETKIYQQLNLFGSVFEVIRKSYVEEPDEIELISSAIDGMLTSLDPHSGYLDAEEFEELRTQTQGKFGGLGIQVTMEKGVVKVVSPIDDTPAERAGIMSGDLITHLDGETIYGMTLSEAVKKMRGDVDTPIILTIRRKGQNALMEVKIIRDMIRLESVRHRIERDEIGYIRITTFNEETSDALKSAVETIKSEVGEGAVKGYVIDLRNNPGGLLDQAINVSDMFLDQGEIVSTRGRDRADIERYNAREGVIVDDRPVIVLINGGSASASEIVAGALQDHRRATIVGTRSFGKGSVQTIMPLGEHGAIRLTMARYFTPSGRSIQAKGIKPDILVEQELPEAWERAAKRSRGEASLPGHLEADDGRSEEKDEEEQSGSSSYVPKDPKQDIQLNYVLDLLQGIRTIGDVSESEKKDES